jgi:hypothetical protein
MLERDILITWRHAVAKHYEVYGKPKPSSGNGEVWKCLGQQGDEREEQSQEEVCATCQTSLAGPLKHCTRCKAIAYCGRNCQVEDWKVGGHKQTCNPKK